MKILKNFSLALLCLTVIGTLAFTKAPVKKAVAGTTFVYTPDLITPDPHDPTQYGTPGLGFDPDDDADCPGTEIVCAIQTEEVYGTGEAFPGKPKVDQTPAAGNISKRINDVLANSSLEGIEASGDIVWLVDED